MKIEFLESAGFFEDDKRELKRHTPYKTYSYLDAFIEADVDLAVITDWKDDYSSVLSLRNTINTAIIKSALEDRIKCFRVGDSLYLAKVGDREHG